MRDLTVQLDDSLFNAANFYAVQHSTSINRIIQAHLAQLVSVKQPETDPLVCFSRGEMDRLEAMKALNIDYSTLLDKLGQRGLSRPSLPHNELEQMADMFVRVINEAPER
ncbi:MAG: hypothetical protein DRR19_20150 [Candidatus Parabeggiatoa sp. nov. 1]|nr:MAG: hypothetical protein DRR19_20150 [Gammaproteobacteria bacterium]